MVYDPNFNRYYDPVTGRPLPTPQWWVGTGNLHTEEQWEQHLRTGKKVWGFQFFFCALVGALLFVSWPAPGFGQGIAMLMWLYGFAGALPFYLLYIVYYNRYFGDWDDRDPQGTDS